MNSSSSLLFLASWAYICCPNTFELGYVAVSTPLHFVLVTLRLDYRISVTAWSWHGVMGVWNQTTGWRGWRSNPSGGSVFVLENVRTGSGSHSAPNSVVAGVLCGVKAAGAWTFTTVLSCRTSRLALVPTQPPIQWLPGFCAGVKRPERDVHHRPLM